MTRGVLIATEIFPPDIGGPATFSRALAGALVERGQPVTVVCTSQSRDGSDAALPFRVHRLDIRRRYRYELEIRARLGAAALRHGRALVSGLERYAFSARPPGAKFAVKVVGDIVWETGRNQGWVVEGFEEFQRAGRPEHPRLGALYDGRRSWLEKATVAITPSEFLRSVVVGWGVPPERVVTITNGTNIEPPTERSEHDRGTLRVLFVGRLTNWKGVETGILAAASTPGVHLTVLGDGPELPLLRQLVQQLGIADRVHLAGRASHEDTLAAMEDHDVGLLLSAYEGLSHTVLEMSERGLPVLCSDIGGNREVVQHDHNGWLVSVGDRRSVERLLRELRDDPVRVVEVGQAARRMAEDHAFDETARRTADLLIGL